MIRHGCLALGLGAAIAFALASSGCSGPKLRDVVTEGRALLGDPVCDQVHDADFQTRRATFLADADAVAPKPEASPSPSPTPDANGNVVLPVPGTTRK